jgi:NADPH-dependent 2,4-dienoyl-CoA reductase/sulfur reductase-like enzyme
MAGLTAAQSLREEGWDGPITVAGAEPHVPYDRPPLSKQVLAEDWDAQRIAFWPEGLALKLDVELLLGRRAVSLDAAAHRVRLADGEQLEYDRLVIATGAHARSLPNVPELDGVHLLRSLDDALALRADLARASRLVVVGGGFIGAEVASSARARGLEVVVVEALELPLVRVLGRRMAAACARLHMESGVVLRCGDGVSAIEGGGRVEAVRLRDGTAVDADAVVIGIGCAPTTAWLDGSGVHVEDGIVCDAHGATSQPGVYAAGDVARWHNDFLGATARVEHWTNAVEQGRAVAQAIVHGDGATRFESVPYFWSDQHGVKLQLAGVPHPDDEVHVVENDESARKLVALYARDGMLTGVLGFGRAGAVARMRQMLQRRATLQEALEAASKPTAPKLLRVSTH